MSEAVRQPDTASRACARLLASLDPLLRGWLPRQRWFAGKGRPVTGFSLVSSTQLLPVTPAAGRTPDSACPPGLLHLLVRAEQDTPGAQGGPSGDCYQLLLGVRDTLPPPLAPALIGQVTEGPLAGRTVYEALYDPRLAEVLLDALRRRARIGSLRFERDAGTEIGHGLPPRMLGAEQSNSSLVYGDTFILKLFRRIVPGINPDLELPHALARTDCPRVPPPAAWFVADAGGAGTEGRGRLSFPATPVSGATAGRPALARSGGRSSAGSPSASSGGSVPYGVAAPSGAWPTASAAGCLSPSGTASSHLASSGTVRSASASSSAASTGSSAGSPTPVSCRPARHRPRRPIRTRHAARRGRRKPWCWACSSPI